MASQATLPPPPGSQQDASDGAPTSPANASPSPAQPSPAMQQGTQDAIMVVSKLRGIAKAYPQTAPAISKINELMRDVLKGMMQQQQPGEPQAPPA